MAKVDAPEKPQTQVQADEPAVSRDEAVIAVWQKKPSATPDTPNGTNKAKKIEHSVREAKKATELEKKLGPEGKKVLFYDGLIDLGPLWDCTDPAKLRSFAAKQVLLEAGERYKAKILTGKAQANDKAAVDLCVKEVLEGYATMRGITPSTGNGPKEPGKYKQQAVKLDHAATLQRQIKEAKAAKNAELVAKLTEELLSMEF